MQARGWTKEEIVDAYENGEQVSVVDRTSGDTPATRYINPTTGKSVVINDETGKVIQVGKEGFDFTGPNGSDTRTSTGSSGESAAQAEAEAQAQIDSSIEAAEAAEGGF
jgi:hypothetical protein